MDEKIQIIKRQTNYTMEEILEKLILHDNNIEEIILEYNNVKKDNAPASTNKSTNQKIFQTIRNNY